jgi:hypothetical protein
MTVQEPAANVDVYVQNFVDGMQMKLLFTEALKCYVRGIFCSINYAGLLLSACSFTCPGYNINGNNE